MAKLTESETHNWEADFLSSESLEVADPVDMGVLGTGKSE